MKKIRVGILDDHSLYREILATYLSTHPRFSVDINASTFVQLEELLYHKEIDVLILDISMPEISGEQVQQRLTKSYPYIKVIFVSMHTNYSLINRVIDAGAYAFLSKADNPENLLNAIAEVSDGIFFRNKLITDALWWQKQKHVNKSGNKILLSDREITVVKLLWEEKSNEEISSALFLGLRSIEKIRQDIKEKMRVRTTIGIVKYAIIHNIIEFVPLI